MQPEEQVVLTVRVSVPILAELPEAETSIETVPEVEIEAVAAEAESTLYIYIYIYEMLKLRREQKEFQKEIQKEKN